MADYIFWILIVIILYSYVLYPLIIKLLASKKDLASIKHSLQPQVSIIIPIHNEELLIEKKILSIINGNYPINKLEILVYSDGSDDRSKAIVLKMMETYAFIDFEEYPNREGKSAVVNKLVAKANYEIVLLTDANIIFDADTIVNNVKNYQNQMIGLVGSYVINQNGIINDIVLQEKEYVTWENEIKYHEGVIWGSTIAPFGACFSFRKKLFDPIPKNFLVDDFFISATVLKKKHLCILEKASICFEELNGSINIEMKRRKRISTGNFQNLVFFFSTFINIFKPPGFCFWSHKGIRWFTPFFLIIILICNLILLKESDFYLFTLILQLIFYCTPLTDLATTRFRSVNKIIKFAHYFLMMNISLLAGFYQYIKGVKVGYWDITQRAK